MTLGIFFYAALALLSACLVVLYPELQIKETKPPMIKDGLMLRFPPEDPYTYELRVKATRLGVLVLSMLILGLGWGLAPSFVWDRFPLDITIIDRLILTSMISFLNFSTLMIVIYLNGPFKLAERIGSFFYMEEWT